MSDYYLNLLFAFLAALLTIVFYTLRGYNYSSPDIFLTVIILAILFNQKDLMEARK